MTGYEAGKTESPRASVVIPAHNEAAVIGRLLGSLAGLASSGALDVHVICNGCIDDTAVVARSFEGIHVYEIATASKSAALNLGDEMAREVFPRLYLDADISVDAPAIQRVVEVLDAGPALAAAPELRIALEGRPWLVRSFYEIFRRLPWVTNALVGSGFYGVSRVGRSRFGSFPDLRNDDLFLRSHFASCERRSVVGAVFWIEAPYTTRSLVWAKARVLAGTREYVQVIKRQPILVPVTGPAGSSSAISSPSRIGSPRERPSLLSRALRRLNSRFHTPFYGLLKQPELWPALAGYALVRIASHAVADSYWLRRSTIGWAQDRTTRVPVLRSPPQQPTP